MKNVLKTKENQLFHPVLTVILWIKIVLVSLVFIAVMTDLVRHIELGTVKFNNFLEVFLTISVIYGAFRMLANRRIGFFLVIIPYLIIGIDSLFRLPYINAVLGVAIGFGQVAILLLLMNLRRDGRNAYQVLWDNTKMMAVSDEESLTPELEGELEEAPRNPHEKDLWERIEAAPEDTMKQIHDKLDLVNTYVDNYPNGLEIDKAMSFLNRLKQKMEKMQEKENERQQGIDLWKHIESMPEDDIAEIQNKRELVFSFLHRYGYPYSLKVDTAKSMLNHLEQKMEKMLEKENERQQGIDLWKHIESMPEDDIAEIQNKRELVFTFIHRYGYPSGLKIDAAEFILNRLEQKMERWRKIDNSGTKELGENKPVFLEQVRQREQEVSLGAMSQDAFVVLLKDLLNHYRDLRLEDYKGWIKADTYNKLLDAIFPR